MVAAMCDHTVPSAPLYSMRQFTEYGPSHWAVLVAFALGSAALVWIGRRQTRSQARHLCRILGALTGGLYGAGLVYKMLTLPVVDSVPLHLTDLATVTAAYALWSQRHWAYALTYYWGLVLSTQALITPVFDGPDFPHYRFLMFWTIHVLVVWAAIYLTWGRGMRPRWRSYRFAVVTTLAWAATAFTFNTIAGTGYGFLNRKPVTASMLDVLGPWPVYLLPEVVAIALVWALMTWPWERRPADHDACGAVAPGRRDASI